MITNLWSLSIQLETTVFHVVYSAALGRSLAKYSEVAKEEYDFSSLPFSDCFSYLHYAVCPMCMSTINVRAIV